MAQLPPGFVLDEEEPQGASSALPPGFVLDEDPVVQAAPVVGTHEPAREGKSNRADVVSYPWGTTDEATDTMSFGFAKKMGAGAIGVLDAAGSALTGGQFNPGERYNNQLEEYQASQRQFEEESPIKARLGQGVGLGIGIGKTPMVALSKGMGLGSKVANTMATGATYGAISGAAQDANSLEERAKNALWNGGIGAATAPLAIPISKGIGSVIGAVKERAVNPTVKAIKEMAQAGYAKAENSGLVFKPEVYAKVIDDITAEAAKRGIGKGDFAEITKQENPVVSALIDKMNKAKEAGAAPGFMDAEIMRRVAGDAKDPAAGMVAGKLRGMMDNAGKGDFAAGNVDEGLAGIKAGRENWARMSRAKVIDGALSEAQNAVGANYTQAGYQTAVRQKFRAIADGEDFARWPKEEQEAILRVVRGGPVENFLRAVGRWSPKGPISGGLYGALAMKFPYLVAPAALTTAGARFASNRMGINAANNAEMVVKGGQMVRPDTKHLEQVIRALLSAQAGRVGGQIGPI